MGAIRFRLASVSLFACLGLLAGVATTFHRVQTEEGERGERG